MTPNELALLISGGLIFAGIAYPAYARSQQGWKIGAWSGGSLWALWYGMGALAYVTGMANVYGWIGAIVALPLAFTAGSAVIYVAKRHAQLLTLAGPIFANLWFMT